MPLGNQQELGRSRVQTKCGDCEGLSRRVGVQAKCRSCASENRGSRDPSTVPTAVAGVAAASSQLPHLDRIQSSFGRHDVSHARAAVGGDAGRAADQLGAVGYTVGDRIAFREQPDVRLAAHEAAHVVQQRAGLKLDGDVGTPGDRHERAADDVADAVVAGRSAEQLLDASAAASGGPAQTGVQMQWAHTQHPGMPAYPKQPQPPNNNCDQRALAALQTEVVELQGQPYFRPSHWIDAALWCQQPSEWFVHAKFGSLASGAIKVRAVPLPSMMPAGSTAPPSMNYETVDGDQFLELHHPSFPGSGASYAPKLRVYIDGSTSKVTGRVSFSPSGGGGSAWLAGFAWEKLFGLGGITKIVPHAGMNKLDDGRLDFVLSNFDFKLQDTTVQGGNQFDGPDSLGGTGTFEVHDAAESFTADAKIEGDGIAPGKMSLRKVAERISGSGNYALTLAPTDLFGGKFSGSIKGNYAGGELTLTGTARYSSKRLNGNVTVMLAPRAVAWMHVLAGLTGQCQCARDLDRRGHRTWLRGRRLGHRRLRAERMADRHRVGSRRPRGLHHLVWRVAADEGIQVPARDKEALSKRFDIAHLDGSVTLWSAIPLIKVASVDGIASADIWAQGRVGPGLVYDLEVAGTFSTRPGSVFETSATGKINLSAWAQVKAELEGALAVKLGVPYLNVSAGKLGIKGTGTATVKAYAEIAPKFERIASASGPDSADYRISGTLDAAGALDLGRPGRSSSRSRVAACGPSTSAATSGGSAVSACAAISHVIGSHARSILARDRPTSTIRNSHTEISDLANKDGAKNTGEHDTELEQDPTNKAVPTPDMPTFAFHPFTMNGSEPQRCGSPTSPTRSSRWRAVDRAICATSSRPMIRSCRRRTRAVG